MNLIKTTYRAKLVLFLFCLLPVSIIVQAQMVTGVWHGKINKQNVELKIIRNGDSITGTSYYYSSPRNYRRYTIKGYFDEVTSQVIWWDDQVIAEVNNGLFGAPGKMALASRADFNCPDGVTLKLDGTTSAKDREDDFGQVHVEKIENNSTFPDEWDNVINNYTTGTNNPDIIDSVSLIAFQPNRDIIVPTTRKEKEKTTQVFIPYSEPKKTEPVQPTQTVSIPSSIEEKFIQRTKKVFTTLGVDADTVSLSFYDNAIVDGDSISLFLDGRLLFTHLRLADKPHVIKLAATDLAAMSELTMVAENLGSIPPNTSYMVAMIGDKRYTANLSSTEETSAVIKLKKL